VALWPVNAVALTGAAFVLTTKNHSNIILQEYFLKEFNCHEGNRPLKRRRLMAFVCPAGEDKKIKNGR
jgi:hypothetical protein